MSFGKGLVATVATSRVLQEVMYCQKRIQEFLGELPIASTKRCWMLLRVCDSSFVEYAQFDTAATTKNAVRQLSIGAFACVCIEQQATRGCVDLTVDCCASLNRTRTVLNKDRESKRSDH